MATGRIRLVPSDQPRLPIIGRRGDLWIHEATEPVWKRAIRARIPSAVRGWLRIPNWLLLRQPGVSMYIYVQDEPTVQWQRVALDPARLNGGTVVE